MENKIHLIGNAHLDILWLWDFEEGAQEVRATFRSAIDRIREFNSFIFSCASSMHYEIVKEIDPTLFVEIAKAVKKGNWYIVGGWYLQPDCNVACGESYVRQGLYGQKFFMDNFGVNAKIGYNVDSFGHNPNLPQILKGQGINNYVFMRPSPMENPEVPKSLFNWMGIDNSVISTFRIPYTYTTKGLFGEELVAHLEKVKKLANTENIPMMFFYGVGDHGGGPTIENLNLLSKIIKDDSSIEFSNPENYFNSIDESKIPTYCGDLQHHAIGCYSLNTEIKKKNINSENILLQTEKFLAIFKNVLGNEYIEKADLFEREWKSVLFNQFHDILGGCCDPLVYEGVKDRYGEVLNICRNILLCATQKIASKINTADGVMKLIVFNTNDFDSQSVLTLNCCVSAVTDLNGNAVDFQLVKGTPTNGFSAFRTALKVVTPACGYTVYKLFDCTTELEATKKNEFNKNLKLDKNVITSNNFITTIDVTEKRIGTLVHKGKELISSIVPAVVDDDFDAWSHALKKYSGLRTKLELKSFKKMSTGLLFEKYRMEYEFKSSNVVLDLTCYNTLDYIDIDVYSRWNEKNKILVLDFETPEKVDGFKTQIPYGDIERSENKEWPCLRWIQSNQFTLLNNYISSCSYSGNVMSYTLLRSPGAAHHEPAILNDYSFHKYVDFGEHEWQIRLIPSADLTLVNQESLNIIQKPISLIESIHDGELPDFSSTKFCNQSNVILEVIKKAEKSDGLVFRFVESSGLDSDVEFNLFDKIYKSHFRPYEIKTILVVNNTIKECNLLEI